MKEFLNTLSVFILPLLIVTVLSHGAYKKVPVYDVFIEGAKEGIKISIKILPYLIAIIVAVSMFRASGALDIIASLIQKPLGYFKIPSDVLPLMFTRSMSGSATLGILSDIVSANGADSYASKLSAVIVGSSETTLYVLSVYFGAIGIKKIRYALIVGLLADVFGIVAAVLVAEYFFL